MDQTDLIAARLCSPDPSQIGNGFSFDADHRSRSLQPPPPPERQMCEKLAKTVYCKHFLRGHCKFGHQCAYAHSPEELVPKPNLVKTKLCAKFLSGTCDNENCKYAHELEEVRKVSYKGDSFASSAVLSGVASPGAQRGELQSKESPLHDLLELLPPSVHAAALTAAHQAASSVVRSALSSSQPSRAPPRAESQALPEQEQQWRFSQQLDERSMEGMQLTHRVLNEIVQLYEEEELDELSARATARWAVLARSALVEARRINFLEIDFLRRCDGLAQLSSLQEYTVMHMFLWDSQWQHVFPALAQRCKHFLAQHLHRRLALGVDLGIGRQRVPVRLLTDEEVTVGVARSLTRRNIAVGYGQVGTQRDHLLVHLLRMSI